jgi:hypothetical protein
MSFTRYVWRVYCITGQNYEYVVSDTEPTVCPSDSGPIDTTLTTILETEFSDIYSAGYINIESGLADSSAIRIQNSSVNGGVDINAGFGGVAVDTTNAISLDARAYSNFTTRMGNLDLEATNGGTGALVNIDADVGINIGNDASENSTHTPIINIGSNSSQKTITIGNETAGSILMVHGGTGGIMVSTTGKCSMSSTDASADAVRILSTGGLDVDCGSPGINLNSTGQLYLGSSSSAADSLRIVSSGGIDVDVSGTINFATGSSSGGAITLDAAFGGGGVVLSSGSQGTAINTSGGVIGIGHWSGGDIYFGTAGVARTITIGNDTSTTAVAINAGTGGITIGNNANGGEIQIGNAANAKNIILGNNTGATRLYNRFGQSGNIKTQLGPIFYSDADQTATVYELLYAILVMTPTATRTVTFPTAAAVVSVISGCQVTDAIDISIINQSGSNNITIAAGTGGSTVGYMTILPNISGIFRLRLTNVTGSSEAYILYRVS